MLLVGDTGSFDTISNVEKQTGSKADGSSVGQPNAPQYVRPAVTTVVAKSLGHRVRSPGLGVELE